MRCGGKGHPYADCTRPIDKGKAIEKSDHKMFYGCGYRSALSGTMADWKDPNVEQQNMDYEAGNSSA